MLEVLAFDVAGRDVFRIGIADHFMAFGAKTLRRALALLSLRRVPIDLHQLREVYVVAKRIGNGIQIHLVAVRGQRHAIGKTGSYILKEVRRIRGVPPSSEPANCQLVSASSATNVHTSPA